MSDIWESDDDELEMLRRENSRKVDEYQSAISLRKKRTAVYDAYKESIELNPVIIAIMAGYIRGIAVKSMPNHLYPAVEKNLWDELIKKIYSLIRMHMPDFIDEDIPDDSDSNNDITSYNINISPLKECIKVAIRNTITDMIMYLINSKCKDVNAIIELIRAW
ncbi:hypothetical protein NEOKW01_0222 [Nematocida sp. AWRm80]|nr:hypothetical protein NEOKW01_0222 [Nematocida sp. AWRm80]